MAIDKMTPEEKHETMLTRRTLRQVAALTLINELHDAGFSRIWFDSTQISGDSHYYCQVIIEHGEIDHKRFEAILAVAEVHGAKVSLWEVHTNNQSLNRIALWPAVDEGTD